MIYNKRTHYRPMTGVPAQIRRKIDSPIREPVPSSDTEYANVKMYDAQKSVWIARETIATVHAKNQIASIRACDSW